MTVSTTTNMATHTGNGVTTEFPFSFIVLDAAHLYIQRKIISTGVVDKIYSVSEYTVVGIGDAAGGTITILGTPLAATYQLIIQRIVPNTQPLDLINQTGFYPEAIEEQFDNVVMQIQQLANEGPLDDAGALALSLVQASGSGLVGYSGKDTLSGEQPSTVERKLRETVSVLDYMTPTEISDVLAGTELVDVTAKIQLAFDDLRTGVIGGLYFPDGTYKVTAKITANAGNILGWHVYGQSRAKTIIKQFTNNIPVFEFSSENMHTISWHTMTLTYNTAQTGNTGASFFKMIDRGSGGNFYANDFSDMFFTNGYWLVETSGDAYYWGNTFRSYFANTVGGLFKLNGTAGQPRCIFEGLSSGGASGVYLMQCVALEATWDVETLSHSGGLLADNGGGWHVIIKWDYESGTLPTGNTVLFDVQDSKLIVAGYVQLKAMTMAAGAAVSGFRTGGTGHISGDIVSWSFLGGIAAQGAGSLFRLFAGSLTDRLMSFKTVAGEYSARAATPSAQLTDVGSTVTADYCKIDSWVDPERTVRMNNADMTLTAEGPMVIAVSKPNTAERDILLPYDGAGVGNNLFGGWKRHFLILPSAVSAFAIRLRNDNDTVTRATIPAGVSGRWEMRWDRANLNPDTGSASYWTFTYLGSVTTPLQASATVDPGSLALAASSAISTIAVTGAALGDFVDASFSINTAGISIRAWVSAADVVSYYFTNEAGTNPLDLASGTLTVFVRKK